MLVLSRREKETVCFPNLGIAVEVVRIKGNTVRLGIDAPRKIRAVRGELEVYDNPGLNPVRFEDDESIEIQQNLDAANLAIHLAQNQLRQGLSEHADEVLEQAIACMQKLEACLCGNQAPPQSSAAVRERTARYEVDRDRVVMIVSTNPACPEISKRLDTRGYRAHLFDNSVQAIRFLSENLQPHGLLVQAGNGESESANRHLVRQQPLVHELKIPGISGLRQSHGDFALANHRLFGWFASDNDETAIGQCLSSLKTRIRA